ncbi:MAG: hypothetical protein AAGC64_13855 [Bacteroidota bacterium]
MDLTNLQMKVGLNNKDYKKKHSFYSKGMRQKGSIIHALLKKVFAIYMNESISGLHSTTNEFKFTRMELAFKGESILWLFNSIFNALNVGNPIKMNKENYSTAVKLVKSI